MIAWSTWSSRKKVAFVSLMAFVIIIIILGAGIAWILISPLFLEGRTLDEELPGTIDGNEDITLISQGELQTLDSVHHGNGIVQLVKNNELDNYSIFFQNVEIANGPGLVVYLTVGHEFTGSEGHGNLGKLRAQIGNFSMEVPESVDPTEYDTVIVWCEPFKVLFTYATLKSTE